MATATMGLRRRVPVNNSPTPSSHSSSSGSNKRSRSENNNSPSHGNLNSPNCSSHNEPPTKKSRGTSTSASKNSTVSSCSSPGTDSNAGQSSKSRGTSNKFTSQGKNSSASGSSTTSINATTTTSSNTLSSLATAEANGNGLVTPVAASWSTGPSMADGSSFGSVNAIGINGNQSSMCAGSLSMPSTIPYMATSMATFVGNATNLGKNGSVSYLDISNMTAGGSLNGSGNSMTGSFVAGAKGAGAMDSKSGIGLPFTGVAPGTASANFVGKSGQGVDVTTGAPKKFQNDAMFSAYQPWVIKTYGDLAKTKTITIKKYARILRTLRGEEVNSAENSKFRFWVKSKGFHIGQPEGYDAKPADRIVGRHAVTNPGLDPPLYVPTQLPHNKALNGAEGTVSPGRVYKKVAIVENFFDIIHAVHVDLEGRPGKHAGQKRTYRTITETYAFLPREAVTRFLLGCTECQRRPRTPSPTNLSNQSQSAAASSTSTPLSPTPGTALSASPVQNSPKPREASHAPESKTLFNYRHPKHQKSVVPTPVAAAPAPEKIEKEEKYNPLSISNILKKEPSSTFASSTDNLTESRRTPESDRASSRSSASSKRRRMLPEGRTPSPQPSTPLPRPWSPSIDPKNTPIDYSLPITTLYLKHQQRILAEKNKASLKSELEQQQQTQQQSQQQPQPVVITPEIEIIERERFSPAAGLIDTNLNLLATIQHLHCQVMLALTERLRPSVVPTPLVLPSGPSVLPGNVISSEISIPTGFSPNNS
ncbi:endochitinase A [Cephus cinctus]|uniref:Endochitinase A n=1 Tax=Cephus cinctus TaxID=211228 RepID=A0AAJ7BIS5_CEPCN|nr:endochitinase A [Cephus cinctus]XP_015586948.1 endochitinase A [Cephus cinctus]XP_024936918.1 endochitinase A [Cephus cinctus]